MCIGDRIKIKRKQAGISQTELAESMGLMPQLIYKYEKGIITNIPYDRLNRIAELLETTTAYLLGIDGLPAANIDDGLTDQERHLLEVFRQIPDSHKETVANMIELISK